VLENAEWKALEKNIAEVYTEGEKETGNAESTKQTERYPQ
jgi:hypothetical protein